MAFLIVEGVTVALFVLWVLRPLEHSAADDLAALMVLSAQTWAELPPPTRPAFEEELLRSHALALRTDAPDRLAPSAPLAASAFFVALEQALSKRCGQPVQLVAEHLESGTWYWVRIPVGEAGLAVGVSHHRITTRPWTALALAMLCALASAVATAVWLSAWLTRPLARLEAATADIGQGKAPVLLPEDGPREMVAVIRRFHAMSTQVQELLAARTTLFAGVSHDLRTPLARMRLALEMLREQPAPALIDRIDRDIEHIDALLQNVLALARGLTNEPAVRVDVAEFLADLARDAGFAAPGPSQPGRNDGCHIRVQAPSALHACIARTALSRALGNLVHNALRYAPGSPIDLEARLQEGHLRMGVADRGPGIDPALLDTVFAPFFRIEASRSAATGGSGLGLAIVRELARIHGWTVWLEARPQGGLQAWIDLGPLQQDCADAQS